MLSFKEFKKEMLKIPGVSVVAKAWGGVISPVVVPDVPDDPDAFYLFSLDASALYFLLLQREE